MSFIVRGARAEDLGQLVDLAKQFTLLNLPADKRVLGAKIERSIESFAGKRDKKDAEYLFILEDLEEKMVAGSSLIMAKHGTEEIPHSFFKLSKKNLYSEDLGLGFIHQVLRFGIDEDGPSEIGGLLVDRMYRRRPEKLGKQISLTRFMYMAMEPARFEERVLCELTPPLTEEGRSEFWEALGRRFTGLPYQEADMLSQTHKEFITSLFPDENIYLGLLDAKARLVVGRVGEQTKPAQHLLESIGFTYLDEVDPFDGGPHFGAKRADILPVKSCKKLKLAEFKDAAFKTAGMVAINTGNKFRSIVANHDIRGGEVCIPAASRALLQLDLGQEVHVSPLHYPHPGKELA